MLEDRDYMRQPAYHEPRVSFTIALLVINAVVFVVQLISTNFPNGQQIQDNYFALSLDGLERYRIWQFLTFQFMHSTHDWLHIIFNSLVIYFFGRSVETVLGRSRFLALYLSSGIIGGVAQMICAYFFKDFYTPVIGASAGAAGLIAAFAVLNWEERFTLLIYFIPVVMCGRTLFWGSIGVTIICGFIPNTGIANAAHLGGILTGFACVRYIFGRWQREELLPHQEPRELAAAGKGKSKFWGSAAKTDEDLSAAEFLQKEVDPILEKISAHGIHSLTARERETLEKARSKISKG
jgi:membrane associated rhomboid family serine protease